MPRFSPFCLHVTSTDKAGNDMNFLKCTPRAALYILLNDVSQETQSTLVKAVSAVLDSFGPKRY